MWFWGAVLSRSFFGNFCIYIAELGLPRFFESRPVQPSLMSCNAGISGWFPWPVDGKSDPPGSWVGDMSGLGYNFRVQSSAYNGPINGGYMPHFGLGAYAVFWTDLRGVCRILDWFFR